MDYDLCEIGKPVYKNRAEYEEDVAKFREEVKKEIDAFIKKVRDKKDG